MRGRGSFVPVLVLLLAGCDALLYGPEPAADPETVIDLMWREVDLHYAAFAEKGVDWDVVHATYRPRVGPHTSAVELRATAIAMLSELRDGHVSLTTPQGGWAWDGWRAGRPENYDPAVVRKYVVGGLSGTPGGRITYGRLNGGAGYIHIRDFTGAGWAGDIDRAVSALADVPALVIDVRGNGGGTDNLMYPIAGRFADRKRHFATVYFRDGPAHDDFHEGIERFIEPRGERRFTGPTILLTNRRVFSTGEAFVSALGVLPHVTVVGDTTGGGAGNPINRELPNGWSFRVPRSKAVTAGGLNYEGVGLPPDVPVQIEEADAAAGRDTILERALALLAG
ncbi:MAG: S41 family peptidase [Gemmatimonadota bacterium]